MTKTSSVIGRGKRNAFPFQPSYSLSFLYVYTERIKDNVLCSGAVICTAAFLKEMNSILTVFALVGIDRVLKVLAEKYLSDGNALVLIPKVIGLKLLQGGNTGAAFGILSGHTMLLSLISSVFSFLLLYALLFKRFKSKWIKAAFVLIAAGAIGNLYDRFFLHSVTDYLMFLFIDFPIFNFADCLVNIGVAILVVCTLRSKDEDLFFYRNGKDIEDN